MIALALSEFSLPTVLQSLALFFGLVLIPINYVILRVSPPVLVKSASGGTLGPAGESAWTTRKILTSRAFWVPLIVLLSVSASFVAIQANLGIYLNDLSYSAAFTGQMIAVISAMMIVGKLLYGKLADKFDHAYLLLFMGGMSIIAMTLLISTSDKVSLLMAAVLLGIASGGLIPIMGVVYVARFGVASFGRVMGLVMLVMILGSLSSVFAAWVYDLFGSYYYAFISFILLILPGLFSLKWLPPPLAVQASASSAS